MVVPPNGAGPSRSASGMHGGSTSTRTKTGTTNGSSSINIPLSARRAERLDMNAVERKNRREQPSRTHVNGVQEAPTFRPTEEEWRDPMDYMRKIAPEGSKYGIVKLIPPESWNPDFVIDTERFHFKTRKQELNSVEGGTRTNLNYLDQLSKFHKQHGTNLNRFPSVDKRPLDLYELKKAVESRGTWWTFGTPSPGPSPMRKSTQHTPSSLRNSPAIRASAALHASLDGYGTPPPAPIQHSILPRSSGFTAVNSGGFKAVNTPSGSFTAVNTSASIPREIERKPGVAPPYAPSPNPSCTSGTPVNGHSSFDLKRRLSDGTEDGTDVNSESAGRRSKRVKKESPPTVTGSQCFQTPRTLPPRDRSNEKPGDICEHCGKGTDDKNILLCDGCFNGYHTYCLDPPLSSVPENDWHCPRCLVGTGEFGFEEGGVYSLKQFQEKAQYFKESHFAGKTAFDPILNGPRPVTEDDVEKEFWRLVSSITETVEVEYGADIHSTTHGSGFPTVEKHPRNQYSVDPWNLNVLPLNRDSLFRYIKTDISGMTVPWLYVGMCFSTFCWHNEDHYTYSANYQHFGATKTWYGIPGEDAARFEDAMREAVPELFETQPDLLFQLVTLLQPEQLRKAGVNVYAVDQRAGQFVITFPQAYHAGFNHGFNFNEAVNFAPADWEPFGQSGVERLREFRRQPCFSHDELLLTAAAAKDMTIETAKWLAPALQKTFEREKNVRDGFDESVVQKTYLLRTKDENAEPSRIHFERHTDNTDVPEDEYLCSYCHTYSYLSRFECQNSKKLACLDHINAIDCCNTEDGHIVHVRMTTNRLEQILNKTWDKAKLPETWIEKFQTAIEDTPKPQLKVLKSLVSEGDRIPWPLPQLPDLKQFVDKCNEWVEEAQVYITRKQQNRRKSEKVWRKGSQAKLAEMDERDKELRKMSNIKRLLADADQIGFECPEISTLQERLDTITKFQQDAQKMLANLSFQKTQDIEDLIEVGKSYNVEIPEIDQLDKIVRQMQWVDKSRDRAQGKTLQDVEDLIQQASHLNVPEHNEHLVYLRDQKTRGEAWEAKAKELMAVENVHFQQLDSFSRQAASLPVSKDTLASIDAILKAQREAQEQIISLYERSQLADLRQRPQYKEVREVMDSLNDLNSKPNGTTDLEKEQRRHEDWMRRGKKLFGKSNAPLHILLQHMEIVDNHNKACFDLADQLREGPVEPSSRGQTPEEGHQGPTNSNRDVFCLCRTPEAGLMIECHICHEWYHSKCLKIARGKVKEDDDFVCPVCDYRVKIPRDANRPKIEELQAWQAEIPTLPFQPDEEQCLTSLVDTAQAFRDYISPFCNVSSGMVSTNEELPMIRFYLRKLEGADVLLAYESNFFRKSYTDYTHSVRRSSNPGGLFQYQKATSDETAKLMAQMGVDNPDDLPQHLKTKAYNVKKRQAQDEQKAHRTPSQSSGTSGHALSKRGSYRDHTPTTLNFRPPLTATAFPTKPHHQQPQTPQISAPFTAAASATSLPTFGSPLGFGVGSASTTPSNMDPSLFTSGVGLGAFVDERHRRDSSYHDHDHRQEHGHDHHSDVYGHSGSSQQSANFDNIFADLTNLDDGPDDSGTGEPMASTNLDPSLID